MPGVLKRSAEFNAPAAGLTEPGEAIAKIAEALICFTF
jgi:hypothetical protein